LGLATLAGINLYLTVFVTGMAVQFGWVVLPPHLQDLVVLGNPWVISIAGALYFMEFFADKVPWVDSANDALHTLVRPLGGALLAVLALGEADPAIKVIAALLAGGAALTAHAAKAGSRLMANLSPEPFSNIGLSLGEDVLVLGGLGLLLWHPLVACVVAILALGLIWSLLPGLLRGVRSTAWLAWRRVSGRGLEAGASPTLPAIFQEQLQRKMGESAEFAVPCITGAGPRVPKGCFGWLAYLEDGSLAFLGSRARAPLGFEIIPVAGARIERESRFLCERLLVRPSRGTAYDFIFEKGYGRQVDELARQLARLTPQEEKAAMAV
ncbi:MAG TPA: DUF4126 domain-containing protein, partial [Terrimicrobiaceae bacterium]